MKKLPDVLVLNKSYAAIHIIDWRKAISLVYQDAARAMDHEYVVYEFNDWLKFSDKFCGKLPTVETTSRKIVVPEIIVLKKYDKLPIRDVKYSRQSLFQRDNNKCGYCGGVFPRKELTIDHIIPKSKGGKTTWDNTVAACFKCNSRKADKTVEEAGMNLQFKAKKPKWYIPFDALNTYKSVHVPAAWSQFLGVISSTD